MAEVDTTTTEEKAHSVGWATANKWYPKYWPKSRLKNLVKKNCLYDWEYLLLTGEEYAA